MGRISRRSKNISSLSCFFRFDRNFLLFACTCSSSLLLLFFPPLWGDELTIDPPTRREVEINACLPLPLPSPLCTLEESVVVDLIDPIYENGTLTTEKGGVLTAPYLRIQAEKITYIRKLDEDPPLFTVACEGNLLIDYKEWVLVGDSLFYDFLNHKGFIINGRLSDPPWYIAGREFVLADEGGL